MERIFTCIAAFGGFLAVGAGTLASHVVKDQVGEEMTMVFRIGVQYQMYHVFALFAIAWVYSRRPGGMLNAAGWTMILGTIFFSGSLYGLAVTGLSFWGPLAAVGGTLLMLGWLLLAVGALGIRMKA